MSYQSTTPNLGLPQWVLSDGPQMSDFNGAFQDIDNFAGEKGAANGIATLDASGKVVQNPASAGVANGLATLDTNGKLIQPPTYDYVTEQGTSDGWSYKKWSSGKVECWGIKTVNGAINDNQSVSPHTKLALPFNIYNRSLQLMSITSSIGWKVRFAYINPSSPTDGQVATIVYTVDGTNTETNLAASIYIVGKWK